MQKLRLTIDIAVNRATDDGITKTIEEVKNGLILYPDDVVDGFVVSTDIAGCDNIKHFFLREAHFVNVEII